ncbi:MAG TPA: pyridoxal-dependent decarboxylase [Thermoanaerobaculia bacterium]|nr:pyridoxal-dependent decarboxylase [Thermoanaerobaculia bacterium]
MTGDLPSEEIRQALHRAADRIADYLQSVESYPVVPRIQPGDVARELPAAPPAQPESMDAILDDYERLIEPNMTHWNHPGFLAYFGITGSGPGIVGEALTAALNSNAMLWRSGPAPTELEGRVCDWVRQMMDLPEGFRGHINDTASTSSLVALAAARHSLSGLDVRVRGLAGRPDVPPLVVYASDQAHSSIDKAAIVLGLGQENVRRVESDAEFRMSVPKLAEAIAVDRAAGKRPMAVVATVGTTSSTSVDPVEEIADLCGREGIWLHVDAAYAGSAAICPELRALMRGIERADSLVTNPHKWLFTPVDCSLLYVRDQTLLRDAFSLIPEYLRTGDSGVTNLMDLGFQLGRRFRSLKLWMVIRAYGVEGLRERIREHCALARDLAARIAAEPGFELAAPVPFSTVCFRAGETDHLNEQLLARVNAEGPFFLSHTVLNGRYTLRVAIGNIRTDSRHIDALWDLLRDSAVSLRSRGAE